MFNDRTGAAAARNEAAFLIQQYQRDTGELMSDISVPLYLIEPIEASDASEDAVLSELDRGWSELRFDDAMSLVKRFRESSPGSD